MCVCVMGRVEQPLGLISVEHLINPLIPSLIVALVSVVSRMSASPPDI